MRHLLADIHPHDERAVSVIHPGKALVHLLLRAESLDDAQSAQRLFHLAHGVAPELLRLDAAGFQFPAHIAHEPAEEGHEEEREERELPGDEYQRGEIGNDEDGILEQHVQGRHDAVLYLLHVSAHAGDDVPLSLFAEEAQREAVDLLVDLVADVSHHSRADGDDRRGGQEVGSCLQEGGKGQEETYQQQRSSLSAFPDELSHVEVGVVAYHVLYRSLAPFHQPGGRGGSLCLEEYLQDGDESGEREDVQYRREDIEHHREREGTLIGMYEASQDEPEFLYHVTNIRLNFESRKFSRVICLFPHRKGSRWWSG